MDWYLVAFVFGILGGFIITGLIIDPIARKNGERIGLKKALVACRENKNRYKGSSEKQSDRERRLYYRAMAGGAMGCIEAIERELEKT